MSDLFLPKSSSNTLFPIEALKAAYEFLAAGIDVDYVVLVQRRRGQDAHVQFVKSAHVLTLDLPGDTSLKLWNLLQTSYDRTKLIPMAFRDEGGFIWVGLLDASKYIVKRE